MSTTYERLDLIEQIYMDAIINEPYDLAQAKTPEQVSAIQANVAVAKQAYFQAAAEILTQSGSVVEQAFQAAKDAQASVKAARAGSAEIPTLLSKLQSATQSATDLLNAAKAATTKPT